MISEIQHCRLKFKKHSSGTLKLPRKFIVLPHSDDVTSYNILKTSFRKITITFEICIKKAGPHLDSFDNDLRYLFVQ